MKYSDDFDINTFEFWAGAVPVIERVRKEDLLEEAAVLIEAAFEDEIPTAQEINLYVWFHLTEDLLTTYNKSLGPKDSPWPEDQSSED